MADEWTKGPLRRLPEGFARYCLTYRVRYGSGWKDFKMEATAKIAWDTERKLAADLHARLDTKGRPFEIQHVENVGTEVPVDGGAVVTPEKWEEMKRKEREQFTDKEFEERAKELGLWIPPNNRKVH